MRMECPHSIHSGTYEELLTRSIFQLLNSLKSLPEPVASFDARRIRESHLKRRSPYCGALITREIEEPLYDCAKDIVGIWISLNLTYEEWLNSFLISLLKKMSFGKSSSSTTAAS